jgi:hypothetical protein
MAQTKSNTEDDYHVTPQNQLLLSAISILHQTRRGHVWKRWILPMRRQSRNMFQQALPESKREAGMVGQTAQTIMPGMRNYPDDENHATPTGRHPHN